MNKSLVCLLSFGMMIQLTSPILAQEEIEETEEIEEIEEVVEQENADEYEESYDDDYREDWWNNPPSYNIDINDLPTHKEWDGYDYKSATDNPKRLAALQKAVDMITVYWKCPFDFNTWEMDGWNPDMQQWIQDAFDEGSFGYKKDRIYTGIPYSQKSRYYDDIKWRNLVHSPNFSLADIHTSTNQCSKGMDCSSFVSMCLNAAGAPNVSLTTASIPNNKYLKLIEGDTLEERLKQLQPGDLILRPGHVSLYAGPEKTEYGEYLVIFEQTMDEPTHEGAINIKYANGYKFYTLKSYDNLPDPHNIKYVMNGGINNLNNPSSYYKENVTLKEPTREDYIFDGWYTDSKFVNPISTIEISIAKDITVYAKWKAKSYPIYYELYGGTNSTGNPSSYTKEKAVTLKTPVKNGYKFLGWYSDSDYTTKISSIKLGSTGEKRVFAKWSPITYKITYVCNSGKNDISNPKTFNIESQIKLCDPTRKGYMFKGWYLDKLFETPISEIEPGMFGNKSLYAKWEVIPYSIKYHTQDGFNSEKNPETYTVKKAVSLKNPIKAGYTFKGWYKDELFTGKKVTSIPAGSTGNVELFAKWSINTYKITYNLNKGVNPADTIKTFTIKDTVQLPVPSRKGYSFAGWYTNAKFTEELTTITKGTDHNISVYAKWIKN